MYAREDDLPAREVVVHWRAEAAGWSASLQYTEGHYTSLELVGNRVPSVALDFSYMDEDLLGTASKERPAWQLIARIPFITAFRTWDAARNHVFRYPVSNRYVDLDGAGADWRRRLDFKYAPLFHQLQQAFLRLRHAELLGATLLAEDSGNPVHVVESDPRFMYEFWSLDPNIAALFGQKFTNSVGVHDPFAATEGARYDYMVSTAWGAESQRLYYITQNVSPATTPPILPPTNLRTEQSEGRYREGDDTYYRGSVLWNSPQAPANAAACDPVAYDVRRLSEDGSYEVLTHRVIAAASSDPEKRFLDSPVQVAVSPPDLGIPSILAGLSATQIAARQVQRMVQAQNSAQMITAMQADAFIEMANSPITDFFGATAPGEFPHWVQVPPSIESVSRAYSVRSIDLFGRVSAWTGDSTLQVKHQDALPMATDVRVERVGASDLEISWMVDSEQIWSDAAANHFRVLWRIEKADRQFLETAYYDLFARSPSAAEYASQGERLRRRQVTRHALIAELAVSTEYDTRNGSSNASFLDAIHRDLFRRAPTSTETTQKNARLTSGVTREVIVLEMLAADAYSPSDGRRFALWMDRALPRTDAAIPAAVAYKPAVQSTVWQVGDLAGRSIHGRILDGPGNVLSRSGARADAEEKALLDGRDRIVTLTTDQALLGAVPFVDIAARYGAAASLPAGFVDRVQLTLAGTSYPVVGVERGERLRLIVRVTPSGTADPADRLLAAMGTRRDFVLTFGTTKSAISWSQGVDAGNFPELTTDDEVVTAITVPLRVQALVDRPTLYFRTSALPEITGREGWTEEHPWLSYTYRGHPRRAPVVELARLTLERAALHFGKVQVATTSPARSIVLTNSAPTSLRVLRVESNRAAFAVDGAYNNLTVGASGLLSVGVQFSPSTTGALEGEITFVTDRGSIRCQVTGHGVSTASDVASDARTSAARHFLAGLTVTPVMTEQDGDETWTPAFPGEMLEEALRSTGVAAMQFNLELPQRKFVELSDIRVGDGTDAAKRLELTKRASLSFVESPPEKPKMRYMADVLTRPSGASGSRLGFVIRAAPALPDAAKVPGAGQACTFYPRYVERFRLPAEVTTGDRPMLTLGIAISTHTKAPGAPYDADDLDSLVSVPERLTLPGQATEPAPPSPPTRCDATWFSTVYAGLPKVLDNKKVVQVSFDPTDSTLMNGTPLSALTSGYYELFRASQDALRYALFANPKTGDPSADDWLKTKPPDQLNILVARLLCDWGTQFGLNSAFASVGRIDGLQPGEHVDQIEGVAPGSYFYACRTVLQGVPPGALRLLPVTAIVANTAAPETPLIEKVFATDSEVVLEWKRYEPALVDTYEVYRAYSSAAARDPRAMQTVAILATAATSVSPTISIARLRTSKESVELVCRAGRVSPFLVADEVLSIAGVFKKSAFVETAWPLNSQTAQNYFATGASLDATNNEIAGLDTAALGGEALVVVYRTKRVAAFRAPVPVASGQIILPRVQTVTAVYWAQTYNDSVSPSRGLNLATAETRFAYQSIRPVAEYGSNDVVLAYTRADGQNATLRGLIRTGNRVDVPFGPRVLGVRGVYKANEFSPQEPPVAQSAQNYYTGSSTYDSAAQQIMNLSLPDGTDTFVVVDFEEQRWVDKSAFESVNLGAAGLAAGDTVIGIYETSSFAPGADPTTVQATRNYLGAKRTTSAARLAFLSTLPAGAAVTLAVRDSAGQVRTAGSNLRCYEFSDGDQSAHDYVFYRLRGIRIFDGGAKTVKSEASPLQKIQFRQG